MSLSLHCSEFCTDTAKYLFPAIGACLKQQRRAFLIVPEQETVWAEKEAAERLPHNAPLFFEVSNFSRLANTVFRTVGGIAAKYSDATVKALCMWKALTDLPAQGLPGSRGVTVSQVEQALSAMGEMRSLAIDADMLAQAATSSSVSTDEKMPEALLNKCQTLSDILTAFHKTHDTVFNDAAEDVGVMAKKLQENPSVFENATFFFDGFTSFTAHQLKVLDVLLRRADVTVWITLPQGEKESFAFTELRMTRDKLFRLADEAGISKHLFWHTDADRACGSGVLEISRYLWHKNQTVDTEACADAQKHLHIYEADTVYQEADFAAALIAKGIQNGDSYRDYAIVVRQTDTYLGILDAALSDAGIPFFMSQTRSLTEMEGVKMLDAAFRVILYGFRKEDVMSYLKCGLCGIAEADADAFQLYTETWNIDEKQFLRKTDWKMSPSRFYSGELSQEDVTTLATVNRVKHDLLSPLIEYAQKLRQTLTVKEHAVYFLEFLQTVQMEKALFERAAMLRARKENEAAERNARLFGLLVETLNTIVQILENETVDGKAFYTIWNIALSSVTVGRIPAFADEVTVGAADMIRLFGKKHVLLFGVQAGEFPETVKETSWFSDKEKVLLSKIGLAAEPSLEKKNAREQFIFSRAFTAGSDSVTLLYSLRNAGLQAVEPSDIVKHIEEVTKKRIVSQSVASLPFQERVYTHPTLISAIGEASGADADVLKNVLKKTTNAQAIFVSEGSVSNETLSLSASSAKELYPDPLYISPSELDTYAACPLKHFCAYRLNIDKGEAADFGSGEVGTFLHSVMETYVRYFSGHKNDEMCLQPEKRHAFVDRICKVYFDKQIPDAAQRTARLTHTLSRLTQAVKIMVDDFQINIEKSNYVPSFFELSFANPHCTEGSRTVQLSGDTLQQLPDHSQIGIYGIIDRVDVFKKENTYYIRVIDYKSGKKTFAPSDLKDGKNLQMLLYLQALENSASFKNILEIPEGGQVKPGGVMYIPLSTDTAMASNPSANAAEAFVSGWEVLGMVSDDPANMQAMAQEKGPKFTYHIESDDKNDRCDENVSGDKAEPSWNGICQNVNHSVQTMVQNMKAGQIYAKKDVGERGTCQYCRYLPICRFSPKKKSK